MSTNGGLNSSVKLGCGKSGPNGTFWLAEVADWTKTKYSDRKFKADSLMKMNGRNKTRCARGLLAPNHETDVRY